MQSEKIKNMTNEIKQFKLQKIELNRKIKENKNKFEELKMARNK
jgi:predicted RNase H-like nuclease (RuvC/YqgF family)